MRKLLILFAALFVSTQAFATYYVVLKDGSQIRAKAKWTIVNGKAIVPLETGGTMALDPKAIDVAKSEEVTKMGGASVLAVEQAPNAPAPQQSSLGSEFKLHKLPSETQATTIPATNTAPSTPAGQTLSRDVIDRFEKAYENVGIFEHTLTPTGAHSLRADLVADNEEKVFNVLSATAFLIVRNAGIPGAQVDSVEIFMKTTMGGSAGRFLMTRDDAAALDGKTITAPEYFVRKVLY
jgi:hypothetical protein